MGSSCILAPFDTHRMIFFWKKESKETNTFLAKDKKDAQHRTPFAPQPSNKKSFDYSITFE